MTRTDYFLLCFLRIHLTLQIFEPHVMLYNTNRVNPNKRFSQTSLSSLMRVTTQLSPRTVASHSQFGFSVVDSHHDVLPLITNSAPYAYNNENTRPDSGPGFSVANQMIKLSIIKGNLEMFLTTIKVGTELTMKLNSNKQVSLAYFGPYNYFFFNFLLR